MKKKYRIGLGAASILTFLTAGCSATSEPNAGESSYEVTGEACTTERKGGTVTMATGQSATTLDPVTQNSGGNGGSERAAIYDTLMRYDEKKNVYEPHLAESLVGNEDSTEWTLVLRDDITFSTGEALTAELVKESIERHLVKDSGSNLINILAFVDTMEIVDEKTLVFHLTDSFGTFPFALAGQAGEITNPSVVKTLGDKFGLESAPGMGLGPYEVERFSPGEELVLKARDDYWGGPVCVDKLRFIHIPGGTATYETFKLGESQIAYLSDARARHAAIQDGAHGYSSEAWAGAAFLLNSGVRGSKPATADVRVREAITLAIDPEIMNQRRWEGQGQPSSTLLYPPEDSAVAGPQYDPERARELVEEVKAEGWDGTIGLTCPNDPSNIEAAIATKALLSDVGIEVTADNVSTADLINAVIVDGDYDMACWGVGAQKASPYLGFSGFHSESASNYSGFDNPAMDAAIDDLRRAATDTELGAAVESVQKVWNEFFPGVAYGASGTFVAIAPELKGVAQTSWGTLLFHDAYVE